MAQMMRMRRLFGITKGDYSSMLNADRQKEQWDNKHSYFRTYKPDDNSERLKLSLLLS